MIEKLLEKGKVETRCLLEAEVKIAWSDTIYTITKKVDSSEIMRECCFFEFTNRIFDPETLKQPKKRGSDGRSVNVQ
ncbi:hypothetical protein Y032_0379g316 [Ancylostoma ceylanicum]|uniref:Uncharacterized protein n=1 Tax=Ancylostoma ceylanicum TaxID=53326 RepID=A0A016RUD6_9BILA|nr:hypothetical protein Y032_0379g316 [Ancylostoma ceylanicum]